MYHLLLVINYCRSAGGWTRLPQYEHNHIIIIIYIYTYIYILFQYNVIIYNLLLVIDYVY